MIASPTKMLVLKIRLKDVANPEVWRLIKVPATLSFDELHNVIQLAMGWGNSHIYEFIDDADKYGDNEFRYAIPSEYDSEMGYKKNMDSRRRKISGFFKKVGDKLDYVYDMGDHWAHEVTLVGTVKEEPWPCCMEGEGACPPDDCGGTGGYEMIKHLLAENPDSDEAKSYLEWMGNPGFNPDYFSITQVNGAISIWYRLAYRWLFY